MTEKGFVFMDTPGYDPVSATGQVAGGANILCFTTGRGSAYGCKPTPSIKIATNSDIYHRMIDDMDINGGEVVDGSSLEEKGQEIFDEILAVASGQADQVGTAGLWRQRVRPLADRSDVLIMELRRLGNSGTIVTAWCLGTMTFGHEADEATSFALMDAYAKAGGNFLDTADVYSAGASEQIVGRWLKARPTEAKQMVVATKGRFPTGDGPNDIGLSRRHLGVALDESLKRLQRRADRPLPDARLGRADAARGDAALPRRRGARRQDRLLRLLELSRLAGHEGGADRQVHGLRRAGDAAAAIQSIDARH